MSVRFITSKFAPALAFAAAWMLLQTGLTRAQVVITNNNDGSFDAVDQDVYHAQAYPYSCAIASMEMELDEPMVTSTNAFVSNLIAQGDAFAQGYMYDMVHANLIGANVAPLNQVPTNVAYNAANAPQLNNVNDFYVTYAFPGTDMFATQFGLNVLNNPNVAGLGGNAQTAYAAYNLSSYNAANRTLAAAISQFQTPAVVDINPNPTAPLNQLAGQHAISAYGVTYVPLDANPSPVAGANYQINGFYVHDPWTGYALAHPGPNMPMGMGENTWVSTNTIQLANGNVVPAPFSWGRYFRAAAPCPSPYTTVMNTVGYKIEVEPQGPEGPDSGLENSLPPIVPLLSSDISAATAASDAGSDLTQDSDGLANMPGFENGSLDTADEMLLPDSADSLPGSDAIGDWLIPYDGSGGANDVTGVMLIDEATGTLDQATWFAPSDSLTLAQIDTMYTDEENGIVEDDNEVPEPATLALLAPAAIMLVRRPTKKSAIEM
jgi:hypothetical protein